MVRSGYGRGEEWLRTGVEWLLTGGVVVTDGGGVVTDGVRGGYGRGWSGD